MGLMPLHAAGAGSKATCASAHSLIVSSYIPSLKALAYARERQRETTGSEMDLSPNIMVVHMPHTPEPGWQDVGTAAEVAAVCSAAKAANVTANVLEREAASASNTLKAMCEHSIVHFACQGEPGTNDPSKTSLILWKDDTHADRLSVGMLADENHKHSRLAYLSACSTAQQYVLGLIDESIHLGSAFQLMGFPDVVATLWEADDIAAAAVAAEFYKVYLSAKHQRPREAARNLHEAVAAFRSRKKARGNADDDVIAWAPFIHIGA